MEDNFLDFGDMGAIMEDDGTVEVEVTSGAAPVDNTRVTQGSGLTDVTPVAHAAATPADNVDNKGNEDLVEIQLKEEGDLPEVVIDTAKPGTPSPVGSNTIAADLARAFAKDGILTATDEEISKVKNLSDFTALMKKTISSNEYDGLTEDSKQLVEAMRNGLPLDRAIALHNHNVALDKLEKDAYTDAPDDDNETLDQKKGIRFTLIKNGYMSKGIDEAKATKLAERSFKLEEDVEDATSMHEELKAAAKERIKTEAAERAEKIKEHQEKLATFRKTVSSSKEILPGIPVDSKMAKEIADMVTVPTGRDAKTNVVKWAVTDKRAENQERFDTRLAYFVKLGLFDDKPDLSVFGKVKMSSAVEELERSLGGKSIDITGGKGFSGFNDDPSAYDVLDHVKF